MRPDALDAATTKATHKSMHSSRTNSPAQQQVEHHNNSRTPIVSTDGTFSPTDNTRNEPASAASILVSEVVQSVKTAVDDALTWAENKVDGLHPGQESAGPYTSPATCMPSDLDVIASGLMPAVQGTGQDEDNDNTKGKDKENK
ncbi:hypothetical protein PtrCC142_003766 [Pyrenophora tritici-repentis]|nr:hypothetical protein PtrSN001C_001823 [Pyrenophora tritici-repentis]KAI1604066.1 hypothetical protein PtrCC142_003766 [Pyrenophora tritici-repentis]